MIVGVVGWRRVVLVGVGRVVRWRSLLLPGGWRRLGLAIG